MILSRYIRRTAGHLTFASMIALAMLTVAIANLMIGILLLYIPSLLVSTSILTKEIRFRFGMSRIHTFLILSLLLSATLIAGLIIFPHVFLFINAFPLPYVLAFLTTTSFLMTFEISIRSFRDRSGILGPDYSLINLLLFSVVRARLYDTLITTPHIVPHNIQAEIARNEQNNIAARENTALRASREFKLSEATQQALITRQKNLIAQLPQGAIIDDLDLYVKSKKELCKGLSRKDLDRKDKTGRSLEQIHMETAKEEATATANKLEETYLATLDSAEKKEAYLNYRAATRMVSPLYAFCPVSLATYTPNPDNYTFYIVEKRFIMNKITYAVPGITQIYEKDIFLDTLNKYKMDPQRRDYWLVESESENKRPTTYPNPLQQGKTRMNGRVIESYDPKKGPSYDTHYTYHEYELVSGHGLSIQVCDTIEEFLNPALAARRLPPKVGSVKPNTAPVPDYRANPPSANSLLSDLSFLGLTLAEMQQAENLQKEYDRRRNNRV